MEVPLGNSCEHSVKGIVGEWSSIWDRRTAVKGGGIFRSQLISEVQEVRALDLPGREWRAELMRTEGKS